MTQPQPPADYYPDPSGALQERYWDGLAWTAHTRPFQPPAPTPAPVPAPAPTMPPGFGPGPAPTGYGFPPSQPFGAGAGPTAGGAIGSLVGSLLTAATSQATQASAAVNERGVLAAGQDFYRGHQRTVDTVAGGALVAEGLVGLDGPGGDSRPGLGGAIKGVLVGLVFAGVALVIGLVMPSGEIPGGIRTSGTVTNVSRSTSDGSQTCGIDVEYHVDGQTFTTAPGYSSSDLCSKSRGSTVDVFYDPADPAHAAMPTPVFMRMIPWVFFAVGLLIAVTSAVQVVLRGAALGAGGWLLWRGLRGRGASGA
ncbi:DUF2510 domain-containing protein [Cellulomonas sp. URHB0016]